VAGLGLSELRSKFRPSDTLASQGNGRGGNLSHGRWWMGLILDRVVVSSMAQVKVYSGGYKIMGIRYIT